MQKDQKIIENKIDVLGFLMVVIPLISSILLWYWFLYEKIIKNMNSYILTVFISTVFITALLATIDSHRLDHKVELSKRYNLKGGSFLKFFIFFLLWIYTFPVYLMRRKKYGNRNLFYPIIISLIIFIFSSLYIHFAFNSKQVQEEAFERRLRMQRRN